MPIECLVLVYHSKSMHFQPRALPDQGIAGTARICVRARKVRGGDSGEGSRVQRVVSGGAEVTRSVEGS